MAQHQAPANFESVWPDIEARLRRLLKSKSVAPWLCDDIVQETGLRLLGKWKDIDPERGPMPLAVTIANNLLWDETHRHRAREIVGHVPDQPDTTDVARSGMARLELGRVTRALARLSTNYRAVLLAEIGHDAPLDGAPKAINMLRMRARQRLLALLDKGASSLAGVPVAFKSAVARIANLARRNPSSGDALGAAAAILTTVVAVSILGSGEAGQPQRQPPDLSLPAETTFAASGGGALHSQTGLHASKLRPASRTLEDVKKKVKDANDAYAQIGGESPAGATAKIHYLRDKDDGGPDNQVPNCKLAPKDSGANASCRVRVAGKEGGASASVRVGD